jgi:hypothetical protein
MNPSAGTFWPRACIVNYRTTTADIDTLPELVRSLGRLDLNGRQTGPSHS